MAGWRNFPRSNRREYSTARFGKMPTVIKTAGTKIWCKIRKMVLQILRFNAINHLYLKRGKSRCIGYECLSIKGKEFHMAGGMPAASKLITDLRYQVKAQEQAC